MAIKASNQITLIDLTDGYSVIMTNDNYTFLGTTTAVDGQQITHTKIQALCGNEVVACSVPNSISTGVTGLTITTDGKSPSPTLTITATSALTQSGSVVIPVTITGTDVVISKTFSYSIAFKGNTGQAGTSVGVKSTEVTYQVSTSGTTTPTGSWVSSVPSVPQGQYLWTKTVVTYSDGKSTTAYSVSRQGVNGNNGTSVTISNTSVTYQVSTSGTTTPTGSWVSSVPSVPQGQYLWTKTVVTYTDGKSTTAYSVSRQGVNGQNGINGKDALTMVIISSNGSIFKNTNIATTLSAHVYKGGVEVTGGSLTSLGTIKWYKDGGTSPVATGTNLTINPGDVQNNANYTAQLEG